MDLAECLLRHSLMLGVSYVGTMYHEVDSCVITAENGALKSVVSRKTSGLGVRVIAGGSLGIASSTSLRLDTLKRQVEYAIKMAKRAKHRKEATTFSEVKAVKASSKSPKIKAFESVSDKEKIATAIDANKAAMLEGVKNSTTHLAWLSERRTFRSSEGADVKSELTMTGLAQSCVANFQGKMEVVSESESDCAGFEFISNTDWCQFSRNVAETALKAVRSRVPKADLYTAVADPDLVGLILHEAFGHASEADLVMSGESVLSGRLGEEVAGPLVTIIDDGTVEGGYFCPYDDEGVAKSIQLVVERGVLRGLLHSRETASKMDTVSTGNGRVQSFSNKPIVRQTNFFMEAGDQNLEELIEDLDGGLYICGRGARGGEVDVGLGTFTFRAGPSFIIKNGELSDMVRGVSISGTILQTLKNVDAVGKDLQIRSSIFGGCGKDGQTVRVGHGGPHIRIGKVAVGGGAE